MLIITDPVCLLHDTGPHHLENAARLRAVLQELRGQEFSSLSWIGSVEPAEAEDLSLAHDPAYVKAMLDLNPARYPIALDGGDTILSKDSMLAARKAAGAALLATQKVLAGEFKAAFCAIRPPGHHAEYGRPMGFCLFNNIAVAARWALEKGGLKRVAIVDFDIHHGNGSEDIFQGDPRVLYVSSHQMPLFPGTGDPAFQGAGNILNVALAPQSGGEVLRKAYQNRIFPALRNFGPEMLFVSAGFDGHDGDPYAQCRFETRDFTWLSQQLALIAKEQCEGRIVSCLEGGYNPVNLAKDVAAHVQALMAV